MTTKTCKNHGLVTGKDVYDKIFNGKRIIKCKLCINKKNEKYYKKVYQDEEKRNAKREADKQRWLNLKEEITAKRQTPERLEKRRQSYQKNADYYRGKCNAAQKVYREQLHDSYIKKIIQNGDKNIKFDAIPQSMIEFKRTIMNLKKSLINITAQQRIKKS